MKFIRKMIAIVMVAAVCLASLTTTAFAAGKYLIGLNDDEIFDLLWTELDISQKGLEASLMYDYCKQFVYSELDVQNKKSNYDSTDVYNDFLKWYEEQTNGMKIRLYDEEVAAYLKEHPEADLRWTDGAGTKKGELRVYDSNILVATVKDEKSRSEKVFMQYAPKDISHLIIWAYDADKEQFIGKDESGKIVKQVKAYSKPYNTSVTSETSDTSNTPEAPKQTESSTVSTFGSNAQEEVIAEERPEATSKPSGTTNKSEAEESAVERKGNDNSTTIIFIVCGAILVGVFVFLIIRKKKKV